MAAPPLMVSFRGRMSNHARAGTSPSIVAQNLIFTGPVEHQILELSPFLRVGR